MITPSFGLTATERVLPKLALDFTTASLDSRITFTRALNTATRVNSSGLIETVNADLPRFDYNPITLACKGLLIEESRANILTYSSDFGNAAWTAAGATVSTDAVNSPDGTQNADKIVETATTGEHKMYRSDGVTPGASYTWSVFAKKGERDWIYLDTADGVDIYTYFDLTNGVVGTVGAGVTASIQNYGNGWYRCIATKTADNAAVFFQVGVTTGDGVFSYAGDGTSGAYAWGAQFEAGAFATSYIPTTTTSLTRNADVATMTGTNFSDWFNANEGSFACQFTPAFPSTLASGVFGPLQADSGATTNRIQIRISDAVGVRGLFQVAGAPTFLGGAPFTANQTMNAVLAYKNASNIMYVNTNDNGTSANNVPSGLNTLRIGSEGTTPTTFTGIIKKIAFYPQRLINAEVQAFSK